VEKWARTASTLRTRGSTVRARLAGAIASADVPLKGVSHLLHAVARLRVERDLELQLVAGPQMVEASHRLERLRGGDAALGGRVAVGVRADRQRARVERARVVYSGGHPT
jgi:hypothetical protein